MIRTHSLTKYYNATPALRQLTLEIPAGAVYGILGPNGAGKTTLLRLIMGFVLPSTGTIDRGGISPADIGYLPERAFYPPRFTVRSYLDTIARLIGSRERNRHDEVTRLLRQVGLCEVGDRRMGACSRGMLQRLGLAQALLGDPDLLILDEPTLGLDPSGQLFMRQQIAALNSTGKTVLLSSHHLDEVTRVCTHVAVLSRGRLVRAGDLASMLAPRASVVIDCGPVPPELARQLHERLPNMTISDQRIVLGGDAVAHKAEILRQLLDHNVDIRQLSEVRSTLEEIFMEATEW
jgi:ABC-2 type transport system ATP-binding protein